jgi:myo-inositol 2-dehydrogenase/D-chiro-inositol 1-dehydrogenase
MSTLRIGIVGCGKIAGAHLAGYSAADDAEVVAVFDVVAEAAKGLAERAEGRAAASLEEMVGKDALDGVSVCTPPALHIDTCRPFLEAGIPILCEKPLEVNAARARQLAAAVEQSDTPFMIGFCHRFHPPIIELKKLIDGQVLGSPILFRNIFSGGVLALAPDHRSDPEISGGGCLIDHCSHSMDLFRFLVGEPTEVHAFAGNVLQDVAVEDFGVIHLRRAGDAFGQISASYSMPVGTSAVEWYGTEGAAIVNYAPETGPELMYRRVDEDWQPVDCSEHPDRFAGEIRHFLDCVRSGREPSVSVADGLGASRVADAVYESVATGRSVAVSPE